MKVENQTFQGQTIDLDYHEFVGCKFRDCVMIYHGSGKFDVRGCSFDNPRFKFADAAQKTLGVLAAMYRGGFQQLVEDGCRFWLGRTAAIIPDAAATAQPGSYNPAWAPGLKNSKKCNLELLLPSVACRFTFRARTPVKRAPGSRRSPTGPASSKR